MRIKILIIISSDILLTLSCKKEQPEKVYHYSFFSVKWDSEELDEDQDGYITSGILNCLINLEENESRMIYADIYYKLKSSEEYIFYSTIEIRDFNGVDSPLLMQIPIGATETSLAYRIYDFVVEIFEEDAKNPSVSSASDTMFLATQNFEFLADDQIYSVTASWDNDLDNNEDGYVQSSELYYDVDILSNLEKQVYVEFYLKESAETEWTLFETTENFGITGIADTDIDFVNVGKKPKELSNGEYDLKILVYEWGGFFPVASLDSETSTVLNAKKFQSLNDDSYYYTIKENSINWSSIVDTDGDSYNESAVLEFDIDVDKEAIRELIAKVYVKHQDSTSYICYDSTDVFSVTYNNTEKQQMIISSAVPYTDDNIYLVHAEYDLMISIFENVPYNQRIEMYSIGSNVETKLNNQKFE